MSINVPIGPKFPVPDRSTRAKLWDASLPKLAPRAADVDVMSLASDGFIMDLHGLTMIYLTFTEAIEAYYHSLALLCNILHYFWNAFKDVDALRPFQVVAS